MCLPSAVSWLPKRRERKGGLFLVCSVCPSKFSNKIKSLPSLYERAGRESQEGRSANVLGTSTCKEASKVEKFSHPGPPHSLNHNESLSSLLPHPVNLKNFTTGTSLVAQEIRSHLSMQETWVQTFI